MLLRQIQYFVSVVECGSFTQAAEQCYISQSAISQQIQALEREIGAILIHRENRRFALTAAGEHFYRRGRALLLDAQTLCRETRLLAGGEAVRLQIGSLPNYSGRELRQAIAEFASRYPDVPIGILNGTHEELYDLLRAGDVDIILSDQRRAFSDEFVNVSLRACACCAELSVHSGLSGGEYVRLEDLRKSLPCILISSKEQQSEEQAYYENTLGFSGSFLFARTLEEGRLMVAGNRGFLPLESIGAPPPDDGFIRRLPIFREDRPLMRNLCAFWLKKRTNSRIEAFADLLCALFNQP